MPVPTTGAGPAPAGHAERGARRTRRRVNRSCAASRAAAAAPPRRSARLARRCEAALDERGGMRATEAFAFVLVVEVAQRRLHEIAARHDADDAHRVRIGDDRQAFELVHGEPRRDEAARFVGEREERGAAARRPPARRPPACRSSARRPPASSPLVRRRPARPSPLARRRPARRRRARRGSRRASRDRACRSACRRARPDTRGAPASRRSSARARPRRSGPRRSSPRCASLLRRRNGARADRRRIRDRCDSRAARFSRS